MSKHWTLDSEENHISRLAFDFLSQIEERCEKRGLNHVDLSTALGVTEGRVSQLFSDPGNLTLKTMIKLAGAVGLQISVVAYEPINRETGPIASRVFSLCWEKVGSPVFMEGEKLFCTC